MLLKSFGKRKLKEEPLGYWEEYSYMLVVSENLTQEELDKIFERVEKIDGVRVKSKHPLTPLEPGKMVVNYEEEDYEIGFYPNDFSLPEIYINKNYFFSTDEVEKLKEAKTALTIFMKFGSDSKKAYHLQLKIANACIPKMLGVLDESAEKMLPFKWVKMTAESKVVPSSTDLYTVQAVSGVNEVWLHTHGLCRCGITELEILQSDKENYNNHYNLISTLANYLIDKKGKYQNDGFYIGILANRQPIVVTYRSWTESLDKFKKLDLGSLRDRKNSHNSKSSVIFLYKSEDDEKKQKLTKISEFNSLWGDNPIFFLSNEETFRMKALAMERFDFVKEAFKDKDNKISIKIGLKVDDDGNFEHIWFELLELKKDKFKAKLLQEPYNVDGIHEGDERWFTVDDVTDWIIYTKNFPVNPSNVYILDSSK